ncbi:baseplate hub subunit and tail lysozyme [Pseudomonas phage vB_PpuM-Peetri]
MLFSINQVMKPRRFFDQPLKGIVVSNQDPRGISRVKCRIPPFIDGDVDSLPWCYAQVPADQGGGGGTSSFGVPIVGSELIIEFPSQDPHFPIYTGFWKSAGTQQTDVSGTNYPTTYGQIDASGNQWITDLTSGEVTFIHHTGSTEKFTNDGDIIRTAKRDLIEVVGRNFSRQVVGDSAVLVKGNLAENVEGAKDTNTIGIETRKAGQIQDNP